MSSDEYISARYVGVGDRIRITVPVAHRTVPGLSDKITHFTYEDVVDEILDFEDGYCLIGIESEHFPFHVKTDHRAIRIHP